MNTTAAILAAALVGIGAVATGPAAQATEQAQQGASTTRGVVIAQDTSRVLSAAPVAPRAIEVHAQPEALVTITAKGEKPRQLLTDEQGLARVARLTAGVTYTVSSADGSTTVTPVVRVGRAQNLQVTTGDTIDQVELTWEHAATPARGGNTVGYRIEATPVDAVDNSSTTIVDDVTTTSATLTGLDPQQRYAFSVTPFNALGNGQPSVATMNRSLATIAGVRTPVASQEPAPMAPVAPPNPQADPAPAAQAGPAPAPRPATPSTRTIYVCPDGFSDNGGSCTKSMGYTYQTQGYTYTRGKTGTEDITATCSTGYTDPDGTIHYTVEPHECTITRDVFGDIKDPTPTGWEDTGSNWRKKDDAPAGWSDDGSQWVQATDKIAQVVPA